MNNTFINALIKDNMLKLNRKGFTLIELLVVIAIIGVLGSIVFAPFNEARKKGRDGKRMAELKGIQSSLLLYSDDNNSCYPNSASVAAADRSNIRTTGFKYISTSLAAKISGQNGQAAKAAWTIATPYAFRSVGDSTACLSTTVGAIATELYPNYQLFVELETSASSLAGDADNDLSTTLGVGNPTAGFYTGLNLTNGAGFGPETCTAFATGIWQCVFDLSNL